MFAKTAQLCRIDAFVDVINLPAAKLKAGIRVLPKIIVIGCVGGFGIIVGGVVKGRAGRAEFGGGAHEIGMSCPAVHIGKRVVPGGVDMIFFAVYRDDVPGVHKRRRRHHAAVHPDL